MPTCFCSSGSNGTAASSACILIVGAPPMPGGAESDTSAIEIARLG